MTTETAGLLTVLMREAAASEGDEAFD